MENNFNEKQNNIDRMKDFLYSKNNNGIFLKRRHPLKEKINSNTPFTWNIKEKKAKNNFQIPYTKLFLGAFIFFILALGFTFSKFFLGNNIISGNNIDILISGPISIAGGEELPLEIEVKNNNNIDLKVVDLQIEFPDGTKNAIDQSIDMKRYSEILGDISIGKSKKRLIKSILYGEENSQKIIKVITEYRVSGSNAVFSKEKNFNVLLSSSPVNIKVSGPTEINANQNTDFSIEINSNSTNIIKNLILKIDYPFGFNLSSSNPKSTSPDNSIFVLGDLIPGAKRDIKISGIIAGQDGEQRIFKFTVGSSKKDDENIIEMPLALYMSAISLKKSSIGLNVNVNGQNEDEIAINAGNENRVNIFWKNNLAEQIYNMSINIKINGQLLDKGSVKIEKGFYKSSENLIIFDKNSDSQFSLVNPIDTGEARFNFNTLLPSLKLPLSFGNSAIKMDINILGNKFENTEQNTQEILYSGTKILKISSNLKLLSRGFRTVGPFENSGPFPPQVDNETTYTITWTATNSFNNITEAKVSAFLPPNIKWTNFISPNSENIIYNKGTGEIIWNISDMKSGLGVNFPAKEVSFQVAVMPSITQIGSEINLLNEATISGIDAFSGAKIGETKNSITTNITSDPEYVEGMGRVVK
ncbi:MAG: hypothetical protein V1910_02980 [bacterium]